jgi:hypothetical protein
VLVRACVILVVHVSTLNKTYLLFIHIEINKGTCSHQSKHEKMEKILRIMTNILFLILLRLEHKIIK